MARTIDEVRTHRAWWALLLLLLCAAWAHAQQGAAPRAERTARTEQRKRPVVRPAALEALVVDARALPPEFAADALLRLVEQKLVTERAWRRELLIEAFRTAAGAQASVRRRITPGLSYAYTREDYEARAFQLNLDALSLRVRAVRALGKFDRNRARALFSELPIKLPLAPLACADALVYDVSDFYDTLTLIAKETFNPDEQTRGEDLLFAQAYVDNLSAPAQLRPVAKVIGQLGDTPARFATLLHAYSAALKQIEADDRSYTADTSDAWLAIIYLLNVCRRQNVAPDELLAAYRAYLVKHMSAQRCADSVGKLPRTGAERRSVDYLNGQMSELDPGAQTFALIRTEDVTPARVEGRARLTPYFASPTAQSLFRSAQELRFGLADTPQTSAERNDPKRTQKLNEWLNAMTDWRARTEASEADYFNQKCVLYQLLLETDIADTGAGARHAARRVHQLPAPARAPTGEPRPLVAARPTPARQHALQLRRRPHTPLVNLNKLRRTNPAPLRRPRPSAATGRVELSACADSLSGFILQRLRDC